LHPEFEAVPLETAMPQIVDAYAITFGWAIVGSIAMGLGIIIALKMFDWSTRKVDEWELIKQGNMAMAVILSSVTDWQVCGPNT
jgi:uncharacterized membrane protein YjfL (UPF0719 family)